MPSLSIYVTDKVFVCLMDDAKENGGSPSAAGKRWIEDEYNRRVNSTNNK